MVYVYIWLIVQYYIKKYTVKPRTTVTPNNSKFPNTGRVLVLPNLFNKSIIPLKLRTMSSEQRTPPQHFFFSYILTTTEITKNVENGFSYSTSL